MTNPDTITSDELIERAKAGRYASNKAWRLRNPAVRNSERKKNYAKSRRLARNAGRSWTEEHDAKVVLHDIPDADLSLLIGRSVQAIQIRRARLNKKAGQK